MGQNMQSLIRLCIGVEYEPVCRQHRHEWVRGLKRHAFQACLPDRANRHPAKRVQNGTMKTTSLFFLQAFNLMGFL